MASGVVLVGASLAWPAPSVARADEGLNFAGHLPYGPAPASSVTPGTLVDPQLHRLFLSPTLFGGNKLRVLDLVSLHKVADMSTPNNMTLDGYGQDGNARADIDLVHHRIFYPPQYVNGNTDVCPPGGGNGTGTPAYGIYVLDTAKLTWKQLPLPCLKDGNPMSIQGLSYDADTDRLLISGSDLFVQAYLGGADAGSNTNRSYVRQVNAETGAVEWEVNVTSACPQLINGTSGPDASDKLMRLDGQIDFTCQRVVPPATTENFLARIPLDTSGKPQADATGQPSIITTPLMGGNIGFRFDRIGGKLLLFSDDPGNGIGTFVFDVRRNVFDGFVGTGGSTPAYRLESIGFDAVAGRLYMQTVHGVLVADIRHQPFPPGENFAPSGLPTSQLSDFWESTVDPLSHRLLIPDQDPKAQTFLVFDDNVLPTPDLTPPDLDKATVDVAEDPAKTGVNLSSSGNAFGAYLLSAGGVQHAEENADPLCYNVTAISIEAVLLGRCAAEKSVSPGDRVQFEGHVAALSLSRVGANALTAPVDITDSATGKDFGNAHIYDYNCTTDTQGNEHCQSGLKTILQSNGITWPGDRAFCQDFGAKSQTDRVDSAAGSALSTCDLETQKVQGDASSNDAALVPAAVPAPAYSAHVSTYRDGTLGLVTSATASAAGITIPLATGSTISIGRISTEATSHAHGRPGTAGATFTRHIADFSSPAYGCTNVCDPRQVVAAINRAFGAAGILAVASLPGPETANNMEGTPRGYQAKIAKDYALQTSDETVNDDFSDTVAGLEIVYYSDGHSGRSRQIFQFAGVHVESHYGIYLLGSSSPFVSEPISPPTDIPSAPVAVTGNQSTGPSIGTQAGGHSQGKNPLQRVLGYITDQVVNTWRLFVSDPKRAAALAIVWALLLTPAYLGIRRMSLRRRLEAMA